MELNIEKLRFIKLYALIHWTIINSFLFFCFSITKIFAQHKDDRRRVEKALDVSGLQSSKGDAIPIQKFQFEDFFNLYKNLTQRTEMEKIFDEM